MLPVLVDSIQKLPVLNNATFYYFLFSAVPPFFIPWLYLFAFQFFSRDFSSQKIPTKTLLCEMKRINSRKIPVLITFSFLFQNLLARCFSATTNYIIFHLKVKIFWKSKVCELLECQAKALSPLKQKPV